MYDLKESKKLLSSTMDRPNFEDLEGSSSRLRTCLSEAKAKDFKICPRVQGRPQGRHLLQLPSNIISPCACCGIFQDLETSEFFYIFWSKKA